MFCFGLVDEKTVLVMNRFQSALRPQAPKRLDVSKLNQDSMRPAFIDDICNHFGAMNLSSEDREENWAGFIFKMWLICQLQLTTLGHPSRKHQYLFDENNEEIKPLLTENPLAQGTSR